MSQAEQAGHDAHGHDDHGHDAHGHDAHGHDDHGHHAPPAPRYLVAPPARVEDISVRSWVAYGIFLLFVVLIAAAMLTGFGR
ncbi:hypothetical protein EDM80_13705 [bacterium]|nr:MAG: hypothetical protein EDM80_13705 [bacterium]RIK63184.1 MAG: hypothetical protein DCC64_07775 [Planctomycetota bacterium]